MTIQCEHMMARLSPDACSTNIRLAVQAARNLLRAHGIAMIRDVALDTDTEGTTTVVVTLVDADGVEQTVRLSVETAASLWLLELDSETGLPVVDETTGLPVVDDTKVGQSVEIDPTTVIPDEEVEEEPVHPISALLASFFGVEGSVVDGYHEDGFGFGVIAQALWMAQNLDGDAETTGLILEAKKTGDYSAFVLPDGSTPTNWGQFKKAVSEKKNNLGVIVSGKAENDTTDPAAIQQEHLFFGGIVVRNFALALAIGFLIGTYSSIFVASPVVALWRGEKMTEVKG